MWQFTSALSHWWPYLVVSCSEEVFCPPSTALVREAPSRVYCVSKCFSQLPHIRTHRVPHSCFPKKVSFQLQSEQSVCVWTNGTESLSSVEWLAFDQLIIDWGSLTFHLTHNKLFQRQILQAINCDSNDQTHNKQRKIHTETLKSYPKTLARKNIQKQ